MQARLHRLDRQPHDLSDLGVREIVPIAQNERHAIGGRQHVHKTLHLVTRLGPQRQLLGAAILAGQGSGHGFLIERQPLAAPPPQTIDAVVRGDGQHPG